MPNIKSHLENMINSEQKLRSLHKYNQAVKFILYALEGYCITLSFKSCAAKVQLQTAPCDWVYPCQRTVKCRQKNCQVNKKSGCLMIAHIDAKVVNMRTF